MICGRILYRMTLVPQQAYDPPGIYFNEDGVSYTDTKMLK